MNELTVKRNKETNLQSKPSTMTTKELAKTLNVTERTIRNTVVKLGKVLSALQIELDQSKEYITIKRMEKLNPKIHFNWRLLKKESENLHKPSKEVFDANYGTVKAYHVDVWESLYF